VSRDIFVQDLPTSARTVADIPEDFTPRSIGSSDAIVEAIRRIAPDVDFSDVEWGLIEGPDFSIEISIRKAESVKAFALHVRGDRAADAVIAQILRELGLRALDSDSTSGFFRTPPRPNLTPTTVPATGPRSPGPSTWVR
jgi:hypothetical protein